MLLELGDVRSQKGLVLVRDSIAICHMEFGTFIRLGWNSLRVVIRWNHLPFKTRTSEVSNPICSPSFRLPMSVSAQLSAFAVGVFCFNYMSCIVYRLSRVTMEKLPIYEKKVILIFF